ncbi:hypothetical protein PRZ48_002345 [Zasmidium cellare]|uniref:BZIP domain-containing protein n=1 Tax=Zasmidium cellare TaxID=395010 RepID=A0ABR0F3S4_ZASCE|nr:hypothetical protein PRZ48_002345 [Zasmidium cellare]
MPGTRPQSPSSQQESSGLQASAALPFDWQQFADEFLLSEEQHYDTTQFDWTGLLDTSTTTTADDVGHIKTSAAADDDFAMMHTLSGNVSNSSAFSYSNDGWNAQTVAASAPQMASTMNVGDYQQVFSDQPVLQPNSVQRSPTFSDQSMFPSLDNIPQAASASSRSLATPRSGSSVGDSPERSHKVHKRQRNTEAARRYRQRKVDKVTELEEALQSMTQERDELRLKLARAEAEAEVLRGMVGKR